jgi:hypothetical protein
LANRAAVVEKGIIKVSDLWPLDSGYLHQVSVLRCPSPGSKVQRSKVQRLDNNRNRSDETLNPEPLNLEPDTFIFEKEEL